MRQKKVRPLHENFHKTTKPQKTKFFTKEFTSLKYSKKFAFVFCGEVIGHLKMSRLVLKIFFESLKLGGILAISVPSFVDNILLKIFGESQIFIVARNP